MLNLHYLSFLQKVPYKLQNQNTNHSTVHEFVNSYILVLVDPRVEGERVHSKLVVLIRRMKAGNNIGTYLQNLENNCGSVTNFKRREDSTLKYVCRYLNNLLLVQFLLEVSCTFFDQSRHKCLCMYLQMFVLDYLERKYTICLCALDPVDLGHWSCLKCWCSFEIQMPGLFAYILQEDLIYFSFR